MAETRRRTANGRSRRLLGSYTRRLPDCWQADYTTSPQRLFGEALVLPVILWLCAGRAHRHDIIAVAKERGVRVLAIDIRRGGDAHDLRAPAVQRHLRALCAARRPDGAPVVVGAHIASPCRSFSPLNAGLGLRTVRAPDGEAAPADFAAYIEAENVIISECAYVAGTLMDRGAPVMWENSPYLGTEGVPWYWAARKDCASLWHTTPVRRLAAAHSVVRVTAAMCRFGSDFRKYFTILAPARMRPVLRPLVGRWCPGVGNLHGRHPAAEGFDSEGHSRAAAAGQYPKALNEFLLDAIIAEGGSAAFSRRGDDLCRCDTQGCEPTEDGSDGAHSADEHSCADGALATSSGSEASDADVSRRPGDGGSVVRPQGVQGGHVTDGPGLGADIQAAVEAARHAPAGFSSFRNLRPATEEELWREPMPQLRELAQALRPASDPGYSENDLTHPSGEGRIQWDGRADWRALVRGAPDGSVTLEQLVGSENLRRWTAYMEKVQTAFTAIQGGRQFESPGEYVLRQEALPVWAQPFVWDTGDPDNCQPVVRSDRDTVFPGRRQVDRAALRRAAAVLGWAQVDQDILDQIGEGGMEMRSAAPLHTTAMWHHAGVAAHFEVADAVVRDEREQLWTTTSMSPMPYVPFTCSPRDVILQERSKLVDGTLVNYLKPRLSHNLSAVPRCLGGRKHGVSNNSAVPVWEKHLKGLPTVHSYGRAWAVCDLAAQPGTQPGAPSCPPPATEAPPMRSGVYGVDMEKAYCFVPVQQADRHTGCYLWPDDKGVVRVHVSWRMVFGGSPWPNRFERLALLSCAWVQRAHRLFDDEQPSRAASVAAWIQRRAALQAAGVLPGGSEQTRPAGIEPFLDDCSGRALCDTVVVPERFKGRKIGANQTAAVGAQPAPPDSRLAVHCALAIEALEQLGFSIPDEKTMCGSGMALLGALLDTSTRRVRCTEVKRQWVRHAVSTFRESLEAAAQLDLRLLERFTGRLTNLSQFFPELRHPLAVGYALSRVRWQTARGMTRRPATRLHIKPGGAREQQMHTLLEVAQAMAEDDVGVALAPTRIFDAPHTPGVLTVVTDASKADTDDGFGGYAFHPAAVGVTFLMSCPWPPSVRAAMSWAALKRSERGAVESPHGALSMPAGETFAAVALAEAVATAVGSMDTTAVIAIGDCTPAASALSVIYSRSPQLRYLVGVARGVSRSWLGVDVPRELNVDADRLSHPSLASAVAREAEEAGARVVWLVPSAAMWGALVATCRLPMGADPPPWEEEAN